MRRSRVGMAVAAFGLVVACIALAGCGGSDAAADKGSGADESATVLESARETCADQLQTTLEKGDMDDEATPDDFLVLGDGGSTVTVEQPIQGEIATGLSVLAGTCMLAETDAPDSVTSQVSQVTALMGRQTAEWGDVSMSYSYHPESGFSAVLTLKH